MDSIGLVTHPPSQYILDICLVGYFSKAIIGAMRFTFDFSNSCLLEQYAVNMGNTVLGVLLALLLAGR